MPIIDNYITCSAPVRLFFEKWLFISCLVSFLWVRKRMITFNNLLQYYEKKESQGLPLGISQHPVKIWALSMTKVVKLIVLGTVESILIVRECA